MRLSAAALEKRLNGKLSMAAINSPSLCVVSGSTEVVAEFKDELEKITALEKQQRPPYEKLAAELKKLDADYESKRAKAEASKAKYDESQQLSRRASGAKKNTERAEKILAAARLRLQQAERRVKLELYLSPTEANARWLPPIERPERH